MASCLSKEKKADTPKASSDGELKTIVRNSEKSQYSIFVTRLASAIFSRSLKCWPINIKEVRETFSVTGEQCVHP